MALIHFNKTVLHTKCCSARTLNYLKYSHVTTAVLKNSFLHGDKEETKYIPMQYHGQQKTFKVMKDFKTSDKIHSGYKAFQSAEVCMQMHLDWVLRAICVNIVKNKTDNTVADRKNNLHGFELD